MINKKTIKLISGVVAGLVAYAFSGKLGLWLLHITWADYTVHSVDKSYTVGMYLSRLFIGILCSIAAGVIATKIANDTGKCAWFVGAIIFCVGSYIHFFKVWADYPVWYHFAYLFPIMPVTVLSHYFISKCD